MNYKFSTLSIKMGSFSYPPTDNASPCSLKYIEESWSLTFGIPEMPSIFSVTIYADRKIMTI